MSMQEVGFDAEGMGVGGGSAARRRSGAIALGTLLLALGCSSTPKLPGGDGARTQPVRVDAGQIVGQIRSLQGAHWDPGPAGAPLATTYRELGIDLIRTHDAGGINGSGSGDIDGVGRDRLFPTWEADATLPESYNFGPTDAMIQNILATGAQVFFRIGRSNIGGLSNNAVPADFDKYADITRHVVMHYNQGWANGFQYDIRHFEIWNEPDFLPFWAGTGAEYNELYAKLSLAVKSVAPTAQIGGPANSSFNDYKGMRATFLGYVREHELPLDFYSYHKYTNHTNDPLDYARMAQSYREELDSFGFTSTAIINSEYGTSLVNDPVLGGDAGRAAFAAQAQIFMQDAPVDLAMSYMLIPAAPSRENLGFGAVSRLNATPARLWAEAAGNDAYAVLAGTNAEAREIRVVVANYQISPTLMGPLPGGNDETINIPGLGELATLTYLDRRTLQYPDTQGYDLVVANVPDDWGDVNLEQYRIDRDNELALVKSASLSRDDRPGGNVTVSGDWARSAAAPPEDPQGVALGVDLIVLKACRTGL